MQQPNTSPLKPPLGLPIPASPADSGFLPRREFLPSSSKRPLSAFALLAFCNNATIRLSAFPSPVVQIFHKFFDDRKLLKLFRNNKAPLKDNEDAERDRSEEGTERRPPGGAPDRGPGEEEDLAEFTLSAKFWQNPKALETEKLLVQILVLLNSQGYSLLTSIDFGREPGDKLTLVFERPLQYLSPGATQSPPNGYTTGPSQPGHQHQNSSGSAAGGTPPAGSGSAGGPIKQLLFGLSFTSQTSFRCISPPLETTPGILQALRGAWPRGIENEAKVSDGVYEFKLKGYSFFAEDTFQTDSLELTLSILKSLQKLQFTLVASVTLTSSHSRAKDLWIFSTTDTESLSPSQLLSSIFSSPISYTGSIPVGFGTGSGSLRYGDKDIGSQMRRASIDVSQQQQGLVAPGHQRNATTPVFGSPSLGNTNNPGGGGTAGAKGGGGSGPPRAHGSVLVKKQPNARASPKQTNTNGAALPLAAAFYEPSSTPSGTFASKNTMAPATSKVPTSSTMAGSKPAPVGMMVPPGGSASKPGAGKYPGPYQQVGGGQGQGQAVLYSTPAPSGAGGQSQGQAPAILYSTPTPGNVLYSTPPSSPPLGSYSAFPPSPAPGTLIPPGSPPSVPSHHPNDGKWNQNVNVAGAPPPASHPPPASPNIRLTPPSGADQDEHTTPLLSPAAFRDTLSDQDTVRGSTFSGPTGKGHVSTPSMMSGRSGESANMPMWTGSGALANVGLNTGAGLVTTVEEEETHEETKDAVPATASIPGGWVEDSPPEASTAAKTPPSGRNSREATRTSQEKKRTFDAKVDGAQLVTIPTPSSAQEAEFASAGGVLTGDVTQQQQALRRKKSQEAVVQTIPGAAASTEKGSGWVIVNVHADDSTQPRQQEQSKTKPGATARPPAGPLRAVNASSTSSSVDTPQVAPAARTISAGSVPPTSYNADHPSGSGGESSSSVEKSAAPSSSGHGQATVGVPAGANGTIKGTSGFRRLFSRDRKKGSDEKMRVGGSVDESRSPKKGLWGRVGEEPSEPARASRKMTID